MCLVLMDFLYFNWKISYFGIILRGSLDTIRLNDSVLFSLFRKIDFLRWYSSSTCQLSTVTFFDFLAGGKDSTHPKPKTKTQTHPLPFLSLIWSTHSSQHHLHHESLRCRPLTLPRPNICLGVCPSNPLPLPYPSPWPLQPHRRPHVRQGLWPRSLHCRE